MENSREVTMELETFTGLDVLIEAAKMIDEGIKPPTECADGRYCIGCYIDTAAARLFRAKRPHQSTLDASGKYVISQLPAVCEAAIVVGPKQIGRRLKNYEELKEVFESAMLQWGSLLQ